MLENIFFFAQFNLFYDDYFIFDRSLTFVIKKIKVLACGFVQTEVVKL